MTDKVTDLVLKLMTHYDILFEEFQKFLDPSQVLRQFVSLFSGTGKLCHVAHAYAKASRFFFINVP